MNFGELIEIIFKEGDFLLLRRASTDLFFFISLLGGLKANDKVSATVPTILQPQTQ